MQAIDNFLISLDEFNGKQSFFFIFIDRYTLSFTYTINACNVHSQVSCN